MKKVLISFIALISTTSLIAQTPDWNTSGNSIFTGYYLGTQNSAPLDFATDFTSQGLFMMRLTTSGNLGINNLSPNFRLDVDNDINLSARAQNQGYRIGGDVVLQTPPCGKCVLWSECRIF